jgi:hypothetical protein
VGVSNALKYLVTEYKGGLHQGCNEVLIAIKQGIVEHPYLLTYSLHGAEHYLKN